MLLLKSISLYLKPLNLLQHHKTNYIHILKKGLIKIHKPALISMTNLLSNSPKKKTNSVIWFRKGLRIHDNPALLEALGENENSEPQFLYPIFVLDPWFLKPDITAPSPGSTRVGINRIRFLLESLQDLDKSLKKRGSKLLVLNGDPKEILPQVLEKWNIKKLCFEYDTEPYALQRDKFIREIAEREGVEVVAPVSHTLFDPTELIKKNKGRPPLTYKSFLKLLGSPPTPLDSPDSLPPVPCDLGGVISSSVPQITDLGYTERPPEERPPFKGGESEALIRLENQMSKTKWVVEFEKPKGDPSAFQEPATTVLSPYLKFGCLSSRLFHARLQTVLCSVKTHTKPPVSLEGQLLWREFFYTVSFGTPNFDKMEGNPICKQIPWKNDDKLLELWRDSKTGFPWIDAAMAQLSQWGWMHHLARHSVACFLTRGDLMVHWEKGRDVFDRLLIDGDWAINNANWMWLSASAFFAQYHRIYSPISFGKKYDPTGNYIRHFLPVLKDFPSTYIYEPWEAPKSVQEKAKCIIGRDYPFPIVDHSVENKRCRDRMGASYSLNKNGPPSLEQIEQLRIKLYGNGKENGTELNSSKNVETELSAVEEKDKKGRTAVRGKKDKKAEEEGGKRTKRQKTLTEF